MASGELKESAITSNISTTKKMLLVPGIEELEKITSITQLVDVIVEKARLAGASDVHMEPQQTMFSIRFRIDGILHDVLMLKSDMQPLIVTRIKVLAGLRTDEHFIAQDGRFRISKNGKDIDLRVSIIPTHYGENVVIRLLVDEARVLSLADLGFSERDLKIVEDFSQMSYGMILATGPTGSGKTTTLYSILQLLNIRDISIVTIEDPIEYSIPGITQIQANPQTNLTFAAGLRAIVRQDPNVIMVGEIRDEETASIAVNAAMTGHLVLSTLHTNDAATTLPRLLDMNIEPFLIASTVNVVIGQRLVRRLCTECRVEYSLTTEEREALTPVVEEKLLSGHKKFFKPQGCDACNHSGYSKRIGIYEVLRVTDVIRKMVMTKANADEIRTAAIKEGMTTMVEDGLKKASEGVTSIEEILRVIHD